MLEGQTYAWFPDGDVRTLVPEGGFWFQACVHPSGDHAVCWGGNGGLPRLWRTPLGGGDDPAGDAEPFGPPGSRHPAYGASGERLVFAAEPDPHETLERTFATNSSGMPAATTHLNLWTCAPDGTDLRQLTDGPQQDQRPCLSPDGGTVVFLTDRQPWGLWTVPADGSAPPRPLVDGDGFQGYRPWFLLDGDRVAAFTLRRPRTVHLIEPATGAITPMANDDAGDTHGPFADPRGDRLLVHSNRDGGWRLWELPLDGSPMARLDPPGFDDRPCGHPTRSEDGVVVFDAGRTTMGPT